MQALILVGGAGTRLRSVLGDTLNKPMAPIEGKPFLEYLIKSLIRQGIEDIVLLVGYKADLIEAYFGQGERWGARVRYSREDTLLGTGGALKLAEPQVQGDEFLLLNGDSFLDADLPAMIGAHRAAGADATLALAMVPDTQRYGSVRLDERDHIVAFTEKGAESGAGLINGGVYLLTRQVFDLFAPGQPCSLERQIFPALIANNDMGSGLYGWLSHGYFIDIGIPVDYARLKADPTPLLHPGGFRDQ